MVWSCTVIVFISMCKSQYSRLTSLLSKLALFVLNPFNPCFHVHDVRLFMALWIFSLIFKRWLLDIFCIFFCRCNYYQSLSYYVDFWNDGFSLLKPTQSVMFCLKIYFPEMFMWWCSFIFLLFIYSHICDFFRTTSYINKYYIKVCVSNCVIFCLTGYMAKYRFVQ